MAIETVFGHAGKPHVTGAQLARMLEGVIGGGDWVLPTQNRMKATMPDANTVRVDTGDIVHGGRLATCERYTDLTVESGTSGMRRHDIVAARFSKASDQHALVVVKGTPSAGAATDPALKTGAPGVASESDMPLYRVKLDGIVPTLEPMFRIAPTVADVHARMTGAQKILAEPIAFMDSSHKYMFTERVSEQTHGVVLVWCEYDGGAKDWDWIYTFVPKWHVSSANHGSAGLPCFGTALKGTFMSKFVYLKDDSIYGRAENYQSFTANGITVHNEKWVLRYVIGV